MLFDESEKLSGTDYWAFDLRTAWQRLDRKNANRKKFQELVERRLATSCARSDLQRVAECLNILLEQYLPMEIGSEGLQHSHEHAVTGGALMYQSVLLYGRATQTSSKPSDHTVDGLWRRGSGIHEKLKGPSKLLHEQIMHLRNKALAHSAGGGLWDESTLVLRVWDHQSVICHSERCTNWRAQVVLEMIPLVEECLQISDEVLDKRNQSLVEFLAVEITRDSSIADVLSEARFDPANFFYGELAAETWKHSIGGTTTKDSQYRTPSGWRPNRK